MTFNSLPFFIFLPIVLGLYFVLPFRAQNRMLLIASFIFYGWWGWEFFGVRGLGFLLLMVFISTIDYWCGLLLSRTEDERKRKTYLVVSISANLLLLGFFKYSNFFLETARDVLGAARFHVWEGTLNIVLPIGISFHTFQSMSYALDVYRRRMEPVLRYDDYSLFVAYFPQLVAGPIERATNLLPQLTHPRKVTSNGVVTGFWYILLGFVKKVAIADAVAPYVAQSFHRAQDPNAGGLELLGAVYLFAIQVYGDFSGYTDIARGVSRLLGIELMVNFRMPYLATNITDFWRRWHISLSTFLRDYLYIPLGGNRLGVNKTYRNLMLTMLIGGLWHGANWTFVIWGGLHGLFLAIHRVMTRGNNSADESFREPRNSFPIKLLKIVATFHLACFAYVFFRSKTFPDAFAIISKVTQLSGPLDWTNILRFLAFGGMMFSLDIIQERTRSDEPFPARLPIPIGGAVAALFLILILAFGGSSGAFIYFQF